MASNAGKQEPPSLDDFSKRLNALRDEQTPEAPATSGEGTEMGRGLRIASELLAALIVGMGLGWMLDQFLGTAPWLLLVGVGFGFATGILNVYRAMNAADAESAEKDDNK